MDFSAIHIPELLHARVSAFVLLQIVRRIARTGDLRLQHQGTLYCTTAGYPALTDIFHGMDRLHEPLSSRSFRLALNASEKKKTSRIPIPTPYGDFDTGDATLLLSSSENSLWNDFVTQYLHPCSPGKHPSSQDAQTCVISIYAQYTVGLLDT